MKRLPVRKDGPLGVFFLIFRRLPERQVERRGRRVAHLIIRGQRVAEDTLHTVFRDQERGRPSCDGSEHKMNLSRVP